MRMVRGLDVYSCYQILSHQRISQYSEPVVYIFMSNIQTIIYI